MVSAGEFWPHNKSISHTEDQKASPPLLYWTTPIPPDKQPTQNMCECYGICVLCNWPCGSCPRYWGEYSLNHLSLWWWCSFPLRGKGFFIIIVFTAKRGKYFTKAFLSSAYSIDIRRRYLEDVKLLCSMTILFLDPTIALVQWLFCLQTPGWWMPQQIRTLFHVGFYLHKINFSILATSISSPEKWVWPRKYASRPAMDLIEGESLSGLGIFPNLGWKYRCFEYS